MKEVADHGNLFFYVYMGWAYAIRPYEFCEYNVECNTNNNPVPGLDAA